MKNATTFGTPVRNAKRQRPNEDQLAASPLLNFFRQSTVTKYGLSLFSLCVSSSSAGYQ